MAIVKAKRDLLSKGGLLLAEAGRVGEALRGYKAYRDACGKVAVKWRGRRKKVYWHWLEDLEFVEPEIDPQVYVAVSSEKIVGSWLPGPPGPVDYDFGSNLRSIRLERGLRQRQLAEALTGIGIEVGQTTVSYWERRAECPAGRFVRALAEVLRVPVLVFFINYRDCAWLQMLQVYIRQLRDVLCREDEF